MNPLPELRMEYPDRPVLNARDQVSAALIGLAHAWLDHPDGIAALLWDLAGADVVVRIQGGQARGGGQHESDRDALVAKLLAEAGGADFHLRAERDHDAVRQARGIAKEARRMADVLDARADRIAAEVEKAEGGRAVQQDAELARLRALLGHVDVGAVLAVYWRPGPECPWV